MGLLVTDPLNYAPSKVIERVQVRGVRGSEVRGPHHVQVVLQPIQDDMGGMRWCCVLLEDARPAASNFFYLGLHDLEDLQVGVLVGRFTFTKSVVA